MKRICSVILALSLVLLTVSDACSHSVITRIPSAVAGEEGLALRINYPAIARFGNAGAPIVIYGAGGFKADGICERETELVDQGFIEIRFNFPGGGNDTTRSGGVNDNRGELSLQAMRDIIRFANGTISDIDGNMLAELVAPVTPLYSNVGLIGWSNGGNTNICVAGRFGDEIDYLAWIVNWESPVGDGMPQAEAGSKDCALRPRNPEVNPAYNPATGEWLLDSLRYDASIRIPILEDNAIEVIGGIYFDMDGDGIVDPYYDFIPYPLVFEINGQYSSFYSERLRRAAAQKNLFPNPPPLHVTSVSETEEFWSIRNGELWIDSVVVKFPNIMFMVVANEIDHVQRAPNHPHVLIQYKKFISAGARFVRLNPDRTYVEEFLGAPYPDAVDNDAFMELNYTNIGEAVEPGNAQDPFGYYVIAAAGACELADRTYYNNLDINIQDILTNAVTHTHINNRFNLNQNYPNPFNSQTKISFHVEHAGLVRLEVYNVLGEKVHSLVHKKYEPGSYTVMFDAMSLPSGIYFYQIKIGNYVGVKKMLLVM